MRPEDKTDDGHGASRTLDMVRECAGRRGRWPQLGLLLDAARHRDTDASEEGRSKANATGGGPGARERGWKQGEGVGEAGGMEVGAEERESVELLERKRQILSNG